MKTLSTTLTGIAIAILALSGCEMSDNAKKSAENSGVASQNSTKLLDLNQSAYGDGRQGGSRNNRDQALESMVESKVLDSKLKDAGAYMQAFEFQLFKNEGFREDDQNKRDRLYTDAISEFTKVVKDFGLVDFKTDTLRGLIAEGGQKLNTLALVAALGRVSERQREAGERYHFTAKSLLDVLYEAMLMQKSCNEDPAVLNAQPVYIYEALKESDLIVNLLQTRLNLLAGTALEKILSSLKFEETKAEFVIVGGAVKLKDASDRLKAALQVKKVLLESGIKPEYLSDVAGGYQFLLSKISKSNAVQSNEKLMPLFGEIKMLAERI